MLFAAFHHPPMFRFNFGEADEDVPEQPSDDAMEVPMKPAELLTLTDAAVELNKGQHDVTFVGEVEVPIYRSSLPPNTDALQSIGKADELETSDLIPGVYEGGFKLWECAVDLSHYLSEVKDSLPSERKLVLELGCGHGIPGLYLLMEGWNVHFQDYNREVLQHYTIPNAVLNSKYREGLQLTNDKVKFLSGDWDLLNPHISDAFGSGLYDVILSSDTLYSVSSTKKLFSFVKNHLHRQGVALIASKRYYFGVGGGTLELSSLVEKDGTMQASVVKTFEDGKSNVREIIQLSHKEC